VRRELRMRLSASPASNISFSRCSESVSNARAASRARRFTISTRAATKGRLSAQWQTPAPASARADRPHLRSVFHDEGRSAAVPGRASPFRTALVNEHDGAIRCEKRRAPGQPVSQIASARRRRGPQRSSSTN